MKRIEKDDQETTITVREYVELAPPVPSPHWIEREDRLAGTRVMAFAIVLVAAAILGALAR